MKKSDLAVVLFSGILFFLPLLDSLSSLHSQDRSINNSKLSSVTQPNDPEMPLPYAKSGVVDFRNFRLGEQEKFQLSGEWKFYWNRFIVSDPGEKNSLVRSVGSEPTDNPQSEMEIEDKDYNFIEVPGSWKNHSFHGETLPARGYASYELKILYPDSWKKELIGFYVRDFGSSYRMYLDGEEVANNGIPGKDPSVYESDMRNRLLTKQLPVSKNEVILQFEVANFDNQDGGFWNYLLIGEHEKLKKYRDSIQFRDIFLVGGMFVIGLYAISFYAFLGREKSAFYFGLFCLAITIRVGITGERIFLEYLGEIPFWLTYKLEYLSFYFSPPFFALYLRSIFPLETPKKTFRAFMIFYFVCILLVIVAPMHIYTRNLVVFQLGTLLFAIPGGMILFRGIMKKKVESYLIILSSFFLMITVINDILYHNNVIRLTILVPYGFLQFAFFQSLILGRRFARAYVKTDEYARKYRKLNYKLESIIEERTRNLNEKIRHINKDLDMAKWVQSSSLGYWKDEKEKRLAISHLYEPMIDIGGDFFDIYRKSENRIRVFLADATGHGIQASLVTMAIKTDYDYAKRKYENVDEVIDFLNKKFIRKYRNLKIFFTCTLIDIDIEENSITMVQAGHPDQILIRKSSEDKGDSDSSARVELIHTKGPMVGLTPSATYKPGSFSFHGGDRIYLFTDGLFEQFNRNKEMYDESRFYQSLLKNSVLPLEDSIHGIKQDLTDFLENEDLQDDLALVAIEMRA